MKHSTCTGPQRGGLDEVKWTLYSVSLLLFHLYWPQVSKLSYAGNLTRFHAFVQVAAGDLTALSRNYFDQIHFAINHLAMLPGFFLTKMCGGRKGCCHVHGRAKFTTHPFSKVQFQLSINYFIWLSGYDSFNEIGYQVMRNSCVYVFWQSSNFKSRHFWRSICLQHLGLGDQHIYNICVLAINT